MLKIGLTGGIGSGKTTVAKVFETLGIPVYYADAAAKRLLNTNDTVKDAVIKHFGHEVYKNGELDRKYLAGIVFNSKEKLELLNSLTHPAVIADADEWMQQQKDVPYIIKEAALLFESGAAAKLDYVIGVYAPHHVRVQRVMDRDGLSKEDVAKRISRQLDEEIKIKRCDFVITNNNRELILPQVLDMDKKLRALAMEQVK